MRELMRSRSIARSLGWELIERTEQIKRPSVIDRNVPMRLFKASDAYTAIVTAVIVDIGKLIYT